ncbi:hypothetical protein [Anaerobutyricum hallii]|uniref:hypothetical protein n=1 Tax=Anaerobutyricum hallii TaxID=39488 RepID=UPI00351FE0D4
MNDLQKFLNDFLDFSNRTVLFTTMIILIVILIALVSFIRKKKKLSTESSDGTEFNEDFSKENQDDSAAEDITEGNTDISKDLNKDDSAVEDNTDFSDSTIAEENQNASADSAVEDLTELNEDFSKDDSVVEDLTEENFSKNDSAVEDNTDIREENSDDKDLSKDESSEDEMEALLSEEDNDDLYSAEMIENFFGNLGKQEIGNAKGVVEEIKKKAELQEKEEVELQEKKEAPVELILHDQISVDEKEPEEVNKEEEEKHTAITLIDGSDRVMVSIGEKFEAKHTKDFTIEVKDEPEITIAMQDGFVFDGRIHFFVSLSEALAKHITLKDVTEITGPKGSYSGYEIKLEVTDKENLESIDCTRSFNYKKVKDAVLIIQLSLE